MAAAERRDPCGGYNFQVEIDGMEAGSFTEVSGLEVEVSVIEYRDGSDVDALRKIPGRAKYANITLKRGVTRDGALWDWIVESIQGLPSRRSMAVLLLDKDRREVMRWTFRRAWPCKYSTTDLNAKSNEVAIETLEIAHEGFEVDR